MTKPACEFNLPPRVTSSDPYSYHVSDVKGPSDAYIASSCKQADANVLKYCKVSLARLEAGERTKGIPEHLAQECMAGLRKRIAELGNDN